MSKLKRFIKSRFPALSSLITDHNAARYFEHRFGALNREGLQKFFGPEIPRVLVGPFAGMRYVSDTAWGPMCPKWIGCYEAELGPALDELMSGAPDIIVDVGAAEGYYAVGLARRLPSSRVHAFDVSFKARAFLRRMLRLNPCGNVSVGGFCDHRTLDALLAAANAPALVCDIEGAELELLDPARAPALKHSCLLVECHRVGELAPAETAQILHARFLPTHHIEIISSDPRIAFELARKTERLSSLPDDWLQLATDEGRGEPQQWLWMRPSRARA